MLFFNYSNTNPDIVQPLDVQLLTNVANSPAVSAIVILNFNVFVVVLVVLLQAVRIDFILS